MPVQLVDEAIDVGFGHYDFPVRLPIVLLCGLILASPWLPVRAAVDDDLSFLGPAEHVGDGVDLFRVDGERAFVAPGEPIRPPAPRSLRLLRLDPSRVRLASALAGSEVPARATVLDIARRTTAIAAVNAGFFAPTGDPNGLLKIDGRLLSDTGRARGAVALFDRAGRLDGHFDQVSARVRLRFRSGEQWRTVRMDGVDTTRGAGRLALVHARIGRVDRHERRPGVDARRRPASGAADHDRRQRAHPTHRLCAFVWRACRSAGARRTRPGAIGRGARVARRPQRPARRASGHALARSSAARACCIQEGRPLREWAVERLSKGFETTPHPRTVIARDTAGARGG